MRIGDPVPSFEGATEWLNGTAEDAPTQGAEGPLLVHFWAVSCGICKKNLPQLRTLLHSYEPEGLRTVAVHMPISERDTDLGTVRDAIEELGISEACAVDNRHGLKEAFANEHGWVPVYYLFDPEGKLKIRAAGEFGVGLIKGALERMFPENRQETAA